MKLPELHEGETYVGCIGDAAGNLHHVILLPGDQDSLHEGNDGCRARAVRRLPI